MEQILQAALELFAAQGLGVPTAQIAREAGVANGTLFNYFPTKQELIDCLYAQIKGEIGQLSLSVDTHQGVRDIFLTVWTGYVRWAVTNPLKQKVVHLLKAGGLVSPAVLERMEAAIEPLGVILSQGMSDGTLRRLDHSYFRAIMEAMTAVCIERAGLSEEPIEEHIQTGFEIFWRAVT